MYSQGVEQTLEQDVVLLYLVHFFAIFLWCTCRRSSATMQCG